MDRLKQLSDIAEEKLLEVILKGDSHRFVFTGCGTSGRIAWLCARSFNRIIRQHHPHIADCFHYCISGGDESLVISNELPEDDPHAGAADLRRATDGCTSAMVFGITCGLSAPYVAGQIEYSMAQSNHTTCLIGFNPVSLARNAPVEHWDKTCAQVFQALEELSLEDEDRRHWILNPIVGPEPITGSSRMKGGSMTHILLNAVFLPALHNIMADVIPHPKYDLPMRTPLHAALYFERVCRQTHLSDDDIAGVTNLVGRVMSGPDDHIYYLGVGPAGLMGLIDASEMVDTYGCRDDEVRAFIQGGWDTCATREGDISPKGVYFQLSLDDFAAQIVPGLTTNDCVVVISVDHPACADDNVHELMMQVAATDAHLACVHVGATPHPPAYLAKIEDKCSAMCLAQCDELQVCDEPIFAMFALKLLLNIVTTGANTIRGTVYGNTMINVTVSNNKLFYRAAEIVGDLAQCSADKGQEALLKAICRTDELTSEIKDADLSQHIKRATTMSFIVPEASLIAAGMSQQEAHAMLKQQISLRDLLTSCLKPS
eukprot:TRINITY_DN10045_c0_g1_i2.p1 TRINITY_DN10045_c0_g1~~TRINITY_DN10045_c0_g1_i2.p1  ORF type:complete len:595 (+),score=84.81 TRINITY_DN10045_c0_g1_i2:158-1786(+)